MSKPRRAQKVVDFEVQTSLLRKIALHWLLFIVANAIAIFFWTRLVDAPLGTWQESTSLFAKQFAPILLVSLALLPVFLLDAAKLSNRFSGPILRVRRALAAIAAGEEVQPLHFRQNDFWKSLAIDFNQALGLKASSNSKSPKPDNPGPDVP